MGVGGKFWDLLKPYARREGFDFLRDKRVAIDLSFWIVQHETALKANALNPHLRLTFFRTINLFAKFGAFPVFVTDGTPSPLKSRARLARFYRFSGLDASSLPKVEDGVSVERNPVFMKLVQECVELLKLLGMPVLQANGEAEALCAQLNREGYVDACITSDSDAFLFGAKCVIKGFRPNFKEPFECYYMSDIEAGLGLKRKQLIAISLLVGNDHDLKGVQGIGIGTALRFVQNFGNDEIIDRLYKIGKKDTSAFQSCTKSADDLIPYLEGIYVKKISPHCTYCGHPGRKRHHLRYSCDLCPTSASEGCRRMPRGFKCDCTSCDEYRREHEENKKTRWFGRVSSMIAMVPNFPNDEIIKMYLRKNHGSFTGSKPGLLWESPKTEMLIDFLAFHQRWEPSYIRLRILPMMSTIFLREMAVRPSKCSLYGHFDFDSISRVKIRNGCKFYVIKWKKAVPTMSSNADHTTLSGESNMLQDVIDVDDIDEPVSLFDELDAPVIHTENGCQLLFTDENMELVEAAFPKEVNRFLREKRLEESTRKKKPAKKEKLKTPKSKSLQLNITKFYRSKKGSTKEDSDKDTENTQSNGSSKRKRKVYSGASPNSPKSVRRRLWFG